MMVIFSSRPPPRETFNSKVKSPDPCVKLAFFSQGEKSHPDHDSCIAIPYITGLLPAAPTLDTWKSRRVSTPGLVKVNVYIPVAEVPLIVMVPIAAPPLGKTLTVKFLPATVLGTTHILTVLVVYPPNFEFCQGAYAMVVAAPVPTEKVADDTTVYTGAFVMSALTKALNVGCAAAPVVGPAHTVLAA